MPPWFGALGPHTIHKEVEQSSLIDVPLSQQPQIGEPPPTIFPNLGYHDGIPFYVNGDALSFHFYFCPDRSRLAIYRDLTIEGVRKPWQLCTNSRCAQDH